ncbi:hypothetical protein Fmac_023175 [Flemingia macrophylla]|uniref:Uncharacterized protein n=1 Tax=Flemingia macrophylla TaxID=520843 RepID=A0ABD1LKR4_9FABA
MSGVYEFMLPLLFCHLLPLLLAAAYQPNCPDIFDCGYLHNISFPFTVTQRQECGLLPLRNCDHPEKPMIQLETNGTWFQIVQLLPSVTTSDRILQFRDTYIYRLLQNESCDAFRNNYTLPHTFPFVSFSIPYYVTMFRCNRSLHVTPPTTILSYTKCPDYNLYYNYSKSMTGHDEPPSSLRACTKLHLPIKDVPDAKNPFTFLTADIYTRVELTKECADCHYRQGGQCQLNNTQKFCCANSIVSAVVAAGVVVLLMVLACCFVRKIFQRENPTHRIIETVLTNLQNQEKVQMEMEQCRLG